MSSDTSALAESAMRSAPTSRSGPATRPASRCSPRDRVLASRYGLKAADLVAEGRFGRMAALHGDEIVDVSLAEATAELKTVPEDWYAVAKAFFG